MSEFAFPVTVVGIGADGWDGLNRIASQAVQQCRVLMGSARQLALVPPSVAERVEERVEWPTPLLPALEGLLQEHRQERIGVLASGDPMFHGIGVTLARLLGVERLRVLPQVSSASLACARMGWPLATTPVVNLVGRDPVTVLPALVAGARVLVLSGDEHTPARLADVLTSHGFGASTLTVLEQLGGPAESRFEGRAQQWVLPPGDPLNIIAIDCAATPGTLRLTRLPGLPDAVFGGEGQFTKSEVRALTLAALAPAPGELLWDIGAGSGSIAIEWCRTDSSCQAVAFEHRPDRAEQAVRLARELGVPGIVVTGRAPDCFPGVPAADAIFVGGGVTQDGLLDECLRRLRPHGRLVVNAVTVEAEAILVSWAGKHGGTLRRLQVHRAEPLGTMTVWRPRIPITQLVIIR